MYVVAVTGGIGSGKSTVVSLFEQKGVPVIDTDVISRQIVQQPAVLEKLAQAFGNDIIDDNHTLNRAKLREITFDSEPARLKLQALLHPLIYQEVVSQLKTITAKYCIVVIPLLYESRQPYPYDHVLLIEADRENQIQRAMLRDNLPQQAIEKILDTQASPQQRRAIANDVIDNNGPREQLQQQVEALHQRYLHQAQTQQ